MSSNFYAFISRMKYINRWGLMRNTLPENISEHSLQTAIIAHSLVLISNEYLNNNLNAERVAVIAIFHDASEIITGDMPTPVKYFSDEIKNAYDKVENVAKDKLISMLPDKLKDAYRDIFYQNNDEIYLWKLVKAADTISAYIKCLEELRAGNKEFSKALKSIEKKINLIDLPEVKIFMDEFIDGFSLSLDEQE